MALVPGKVGSYLRVAYYCMTLKQCSTDGYIGFGTYFAHPDVELGSGYYFGAYSIIGMVKFGNHAVIGSHVSILSGKNQHGYTEIGKPILDQPGVFTVLNIGSNCWVGNNVVIMADLGEHTVVAAGSVVTSRSEGFEVIGGNPAKVLKKIKSTSKNNEKYY
jgi:acetyltransferase-like isoleucine patch superfamily enzyme